MTEGLIDRSVVFSVLLDLSPEFGQMESRKGSEVVTRVVEDWRASDFSHLYGFVRHWLEINPLTEDEVVETPQCASEGCLRPGAIKSEEYGAYLCPPHALSGPDPQPPIEVLDDRDPDATPDDAEQRAARDLPGIVRARDHWAARWANECGARKAAEKRAAKAIDAALAPVKALHQPYYNDHDGHIPRDDYQTCTQDHEPWPCATVRAVAQGRDAAKGGAS